MKTGRPAVDGSLPDVADGDPRRLAIRDIRIDTAYQRDLDSAKVQRMVREWDPRRNDPILVSTRGGLLWCVDGQHRLAALRELGTLYVLAIVLDGLTQRDEADLFVLRQKDRKQLNAWDLFKAETVAGHDDVLGVTRIVSAAGFKIDRTSGHGHIQAVGALRRIFKLGAEPLLSLTLSTVRQCWAGDAAALNGQIVEGLAVFFHSFRGEPQYDNDRAFKLLAVTPTTRLIREARNIAEKRRSVSTSAAHVGEAIRDIYNLRLAPEKKLGAIRQIKRSPKR